MNRYGYGEKWKNAEDPDEEKYWHQTYYVSFRLPEFVPRFIGWGLLWLVKHIHHPFWTLYHVMKDENPRVESG